jgi:hypothetical protein
MLFSYGQKLAPRDLEEPIQLLLSEKHFLSEC